MAPYYILKGCDNVLSKTDKPDIWRRRANALSIARPICTVILCVILVVSYLGGRPTTGWIFVLAWLAIFATDALDGHFARKSETPDPNKKGATLDERADKISTCAMLVALCIIKQFSWYFAAILIARDVVVTIVRDRASKRGTDAVKSAKIPGKIKTILQVALIAIALWPPSELLSTIIFVASCLAVIASIASGLQIIILAMNARDGSWLETPEGHRIPEDRIGVPNWLTSYRLGASPVVLYLLVYQPVGKQPSCILAAIVMALSFVTDLFDGMIARRRHENTKLGKYFDPISDKFIQYLSLIGLFIATGYNMLVPQDVFTVIVAISSFMIIVIRDIAFAYTALKAVIHDNEVVISLTDKVRSAIIDIWIVSIALTLCMSVAASWISFGILVIGAASTVLSVTESQYRKKK